MDTTSDLSFDNKQNKNLSNLSKDTGTNLHDVIDKVAEKAKPAIDSLAQSAHRNVELLAFRAAQLKDTYQLFLETSKGCIQRHPLMSVGISLVVSYALAKLLNTRGK